MTLHITDEAEKSAQGGRQWAFFVRNRSEHRLATALAAKKRVTTPVTLGISPSPPYFTDHMVGIPGIWSWRDVGMPDFSTNRFWLTHYDALLSLIKHRFPEMASRDGVARSPHFLLGLVWHLGDDVFRYLAACAVFFRDHPFGVICFHPANDTPSHLLKCCSRHYRLPIARL